MPFPFQHQHDAMDCGATCLLMIAKHYGKSCSLQFMRELCYSNRNGVSMSGIADGAEAIGFRTMGVRTTFGKLSGKAVLPCIVHWRQDHFVVVYKTKVRRHKDGYSGKVYVADPAFGLVTYSVAEFLDGWLSAKVDGDDKGMALMFAPTADFYRNTFDSSEKKRSIVWFFNYMRPYKRLLLQIMFGMLFGLVLQLIFPFMTQSMIDVGVLNGNLNFIILILLGQLILAVSQMAVGFIQNWITLHVNTRINVALISDFLLKLLNLPIAFFDSKKTGDIMQRIGDHGRIEGFMTGTSINTFFSLFNFVIFAGILIWYNLTLFLVFVAGYSMYTAWVLLFLHIRRTLDFKRFERSAHNQSNIVQLIAGVQEIKLNNCEKKMRWKWESIQAELFDVNVKGLTFGQIQSTGSFLISQVLNIVLSVITAKAVIDGQMTLGMMMSISYILGQLKGPVENFIGFVHSYQDAKISIERLGEVHFKEDEEQADEARIKDLPSGDKSLHVENVTFSYLGPSAPPVLKDISLVIPENSVTAIVGASGSGKTTLLKLLTGNYNPVQGQIKVGNVNLKNISPRYWRSQCGIVMQDGFIFSESIAENIAISDETIDKERLFYASQMANVHEFAGELPSGYNTRIGQEGSGLSQGQKQRILIARAIYKEPAYLFFDEATNSLDANNESEIMKNLENFYRGRTVVIVAHRLSTVKNADQIVVLEKGEIVERGAHAELIDKHGAYFRLIQNQLELGN
ncbi:MAG: peptidase domain-containing ABC transporter [Prevotellaceae bacterium]|jgi:ATP-binding cassette subfamily B protein|nr:peptidase domain-containing ABC transporter [Prevotellaceae bacterium]